MDIPIKVEVGQVWQHATDEWTYRITRVDMEKGQAYADYILNGNVEQSDRTFGSLNEDGTASWCYVGSMWHLVKVSGFSKVSARMLRKRIRDQIAAQVLIPHKPNG